jgi:hypothetical protein
VQRSLPTTIASLVSLIGYILFAAGFCLMIRKIRSDQSSIGRLKGKPAAPESEESGSTKERAKPMVTDLMLAAKKKGNAAVKAEIAKNRAGIFNADSDGRTALFYAAERGDEEIVWTILNAGTANQRGALLNVKDNDGNRAEDWARMKGQEEIGKVLASERGRIEFFE